MSNNTPAVCQSGWQWSYNSLNQNPCVVAGLLEAPCRNLSGYVLGPLQPGNNYVSPQKSDFAALTCECNTVMYSLFMACTACQNQTLDLWSFWDTNCPVVYVDQFPGDIPQGTLVPHWAYLNVTIGDTFNKTLAQAAGINPQASPSAIPTATVPTSSASSSLPLSTATPSASSASDNTSSTPAPVPSKTTSSGSSTNAGAIAGGVVGGVAFLAIVAGVIAWYLVRKRRNNIAGNVAPVSQGYEYPQTTPYTPHEPQMKLYSPNDPSTFPTTDHELSTGSGNTGYPTTTLYDSTGQNMRGKYSGAPEL